MQQETDGVWEDIYRRLVKLKGVGPATAHACTESVVQYLHALVEETNPETDDDGVTWMKRPEFIPSGWEYLTWSTERRPQNIFWVFDSKPLPPKGCADHWHSGGGQREKAFYGKEYEKFWDSLPNVPPEERLLRLY